MSQTKLSILPGELVMRLYPKWPTSPGDSWVPLISATVTIPVPKMLDDLLDKVTLITKLPLKHSFELLKTQKKVFLVFITQTQNFNSISSATTGTSKNNKKQQQLQLEFGSRI